MKAPGEEDFGMPYKHLQIPALQLSASPQTSKLRERAAIDSPCD
jgi:hypothetical protein